MAHPVYVVSAVRTAVALGKPGKGALFQTRADLVLAHVLREVAARAKVPLEAVEDVVAGCVSPVGEQGMNIARVAALEAGFPVTTCGTTMNRMCGSSQQAVHTAANAIAAGEVEVAIGCGVELMSRTPMGSDAQGPAPWFPPPEELVGRFPFVSQGISAEMIAEKWRLTRTQVDEFSARSHEKAHAAQQAGQFVREIAPIDVVHPDGQKKSFAVDEGIRPGTTAEKLGALKPAFKPDGVIHAGNSSQISDGAAAVLLASESAVKRLGLTPRARIVATAVAGDDPTIMLTAPIPATRKVLQKAGLRMSDIDTFEVNEAFASVPLAWAHDTEADLGKTNVRGGAIALGHPLGGSGARIMTTLIHLLEDEKFRYGLQTMCIGFGQATATILERV
ncbi:MAG: thiolase family protein [Myxococcales bacterium]|nr:thiolase family protein [Myxococcales bacterium]